MGNCLGPCIGEQKSYEYQIGIEHIKQIIKGDIKSVIQHLKDAMIQYSRDLEYEKAQ